MAHTIAISNSKGGTGKTTIACNLSAGLALGVTGKKYKVLLIDTDSQLNASWFYRFDEEDGVLAKVLEGKTPISEAIKPTNIDGLDMIPAEFALSAVNLAMASAKGGTATLAKVLQMAQGYDFIIIDSPPSLDFLAQAILRAANWILIPLEASGFSLKGIEQMVSGFLDVKEKYNPGLKLLGVVASRVDKRRILTKDVNAFLESKYGDRVLRTQIRESVTLAESPSHHTSIFEYDPKGNGAEDMKELINEVLERISTNGN